jgi:Holliday junction resolvase
MNESAISRKLRVELEGRGHWFYKASDRFHASIPDLLGCVNGMFCAIEVKIFPNKPTGLQAHTLETLVKHGACVFLVTYRKDHKVYYVWHHGDVAECPNNKDTVTWLLEQISLRIKSKQ